MELSLKYNTSEQLQIQCIRKANAKMSFSEALPVVVSVAESLSDPAFTVTSDVADVNMEAGSSFISMSVLDCDWTAGLPLVARSYDQTKKT